MIVLSTYHDLLGTIIHKIARICVPFNNIRGASYTPTFQKTPPGTVLLCAVQYRGGFFEHFTLMLRHSF